MILWLNGLWGPLGFERIDRQVPYHSIYQAKWPVEPVGV